MAVGVQINWTVGAVTLTVWKILYFSVVYAATMILLFARSKSKLGQAVKLVALQSSVPDERKTLTVPPSYPMAYLQSF